MKRLLIVMEIIIMMIITGCSASKIVKPSADTPIIKPFPGEYGAEMSVFFPQINENKLAEEKRIIENENKKYEELVIDELLKGPDSNTLKRIISEKVKLISINVLGQIGYVNFNKEFLKADLSEEEEILLIYSIVNTLTQVDKISKVQILIEGERLSNTNKHLELSEPLEKSYILEKYKYSSPIIPIINYYNKLINKDEFRFQNTSNDNYLNFVQMESFKINEYRFNKYNTNMRIEVDIEYKVKSESDFRKDTQTFILGFIEEQFYIKESLNIN